jgi:cephalosporin hydroxylase
MDPLMAAEDIEAYLTIFEKHRPKLVVEWGSGGSTVRFSQHATIERWHSIEHDDTWVERVSASVSARVLVHHVPIDSDDYVLHPKRRGLTPDLIIVDGRRRNACLELAREIIVAGGVVLLHDSCRQRYEKGMSQFGTRCVMTPGAGETRPVDRVQTAGLYWHQGVTALYV